MNKTGLDKSAKCASQKVLFEFGWYCCWNKHVKTE